MQLKKSYHIATDVCGRKSAATFGDLPVWSMWMEVNSIVAFNYKELLTIAWQEPPMPSNNFISRRCLKYLLTIVGGFV